MKSYRQYTPEQSFLLPPAPRDWLPKDHLAIFVLDLVRDLDLSAVERKLQEKDPRGERPYSPVMMTALLMYAYCTGVFSSRKIARATVEDVAFRFLGANEHPHYTTVNQFRGTNRQELADLFVQVLHVCMSAGLVTLGHVAIDGTKMKANASKHKAMSFDRMLKDDERLRKEVEHWMAQAEAADAAEDVEGAYDPQEEIRRREERLAKMQAAREALRRETANARAARLREQAAELRAKAADVATAPRDQKGFVTRAANSERKADELTRDDRDPPPPGPDNDLPRNTPPTTPCGEPKPHAQRNFTDPESRIMVRDGAFLQAYNAQVAVDEAHQIIVAAAVSNQGPDNEYFVPMVRRVMTNCNALPEYTTADSGYFSAENVRFAERMGTEPFISVGKHRNDGAPDDCPLHIQHHTEARLSMRAALQSPKGRAVYARRKSTAEPVFGQVRTRGFQQFSFRGLLKNRCEWLLVSLTHNVLKLFRAQQAAPA